MNGLERNEKTLKKQIDKCEIKIEEQTIEIDSNDEEMKALETELLELKETLKTKQAAIASLDSDKHSLLDFIQELQKTSAT